jgi:hypothetical protein
MLICRCWTLCPRITCWDPCRQSLRCLQDAGPVWRLHTVTYSVGVSVHNSGTTSCSSSSNSCRWREA